MFTSIYRLKIAIPFIFILSLALLNGCRQSVDSSVSHDNVTASASYYLAKAEMTQGSSRVNWSLLAVQALLKEGDTVSAERELKNLPESDLSAEQQQEYDLLYATLYLAKQQFANGLQALDKIHYNALSSAQQLRYLEAKSELYVEQPLERVRAYIELSEQKNLTYIQRQKIIDNTWRALQGLSRAELNRVAIGVNEYTLQAWLDLLRVKYENGDDDSLFRQGVKEWQTRYAGNPVVQQLPRNIFFDETFDDDTAIAERAINVALFLPLSGPSQSLGEAVLAGFKAGMYPLQSDNFMVSPSGSSLQVYDTALAPISELLNKAVQNRAELIVGPLIKNNVDELTKLAPKIPVLALNQPSLLQDVNNVCYFSLSPEDEAQDAARLIKKQRKQHPLLLLPQGELGLRIATAFAHRWDELGGGEIKIQYLDSYQKMKDLMNQGVGIHLSGDVFSLTAQPEPIIEQREEYDSPEIEEDVQPEIDAIYVVANHDELTLIKPMLDMPPPDHDKSKPLNQVAPPIYTSSRSHSSVAGTDFRYEMDRVQFSEIPLLSGEYAQVVDKMPDNIKENFWLARLYAMGLDAWALAQGYPSLSGGEFHYQGKTGDRSVNPHCVIKLKPVWLRYSKGEIVTVE